MLMYWNYFKARYLGQKGQGMVEYALVLAFVAAVAVAIGTSGELKTAVSKAFTDVKALFPAATTK
ncbi:MAG: hypothetical protein H6Q70_2934 [Firmicutes bacterium]|nr:hypothetical protein [Bacillota bacterium]